MEQTKIYPLGKQASAQPMEFADASGVPVNMLFPRDASAFDMIKRAIDDEYVDPTEMDMRGMLAAIDIVKDQPFNPSAEDRVVFDKAAYRALEMARWTLTEDLGRRPGGKWYADRQWINIFPPSPGKPEWVTSTYTNIDRRAAFFSSAYSTSPNGPERARLGRQVSVGVQGCGRRCVRWRTFLAAPLASQRSGQAVLVGDGLRHGHRVGATERPAVPVTQSDGQASHQFGRLNRHLLRSKFAGRQ